MNAQYLPDTVIWKKKMDFKTYRSSARRPHSIASGKFVRTRLCVILGEPRQRVDSKLITVEMLELFLLSAPFPGVEVVDTLCTPSPTLDKRDNKSWVKPCLARGAGSKERLVYLSAREAKHRRAPSATCGSKISNKVVTQTKKYLF